MFVIGSEKISPSDDQVDVRIAKAISSIFENRLPIFLPMKKLHQSRIEKIFQQNNNAVFFETPFGKVEARARLITQGHKTYMEAMLSYKKQLLTDGSFFVEFKVHDLLSRKLEKKNPTDYATFEKYLKELADFNVVIHTKTDKQIGFRFIDEYLIDNETGMYQIKFNRLFSQIWLNETLISYKKERNVLDKIDSFLVQSVIRYMITYDDLHISVKKLSKKLSLDVIFSKSELYAKYKEIKNSFQQEKYQETYKKYGIRYDEKTDLIEIKRTDEIFIDFCDGTKKTISQKLIKENE